MEDLIDWGALLSTKVSDENSPWATYLSMDMNCVPEQRDVIAHWIWDVRRDLTDAQRRMPQVALWSDHFGRFVWGSYELPQRKDTIENVIQNAMFPREEQHSCTAARMADPYTLAQALKEAAPDIKLGEPELARRFDALLRDYVSYRVNTVYGGHESLAVPCSVAPRDEGEAKLLAHYRDQLKDAKKIAQVRQMIGV